MGWLAEAERLADDVKTGRLGLHDAAHRLREYTEGRLTKTAAVNILRDTDGTRRVCEEGLRMAREALDDLDNAGS